MSALNLDLEVTCFARVYAVCQQFPGARFSKAPMINGPAKLLLFTWKMEVSIVLQLT